ncbi:exonuclease domain-containing protein, partial [Bacteroides thetaiotaomicron]|uniref:exonuclease domain-containing protein n=1 Tax=Bacteroides thetaiotaomicron TaxID=818 RepID=UPI0006D58F8E
MNIANANFIAIDFETATPQRAACQIGIVVVKEGAIVEKISKLIQPPNNSYKDNFVKVHGITPDLTKDSPTFDIIWNDIKKYFEGNFVIAHNASFDLSVLKKALDTYNLQHPILMGTECTYKLSGMSLKDACQTYNISLCSHHDGLCDAEACANLFLK